MPQLPVSRCIAFLNLAFTPLDRLQAISAVDSDAKIQMIHQSASLFYHSRQLLHLSLQATAHSLALCHLINTGRGMSDGMKDELAATVVRSAVLKDLN